MIAVTEAAEAVLERRRLIPRPRLRRQKKRVVKRLGLDRKFGKMQSRERKKGKYETKNRKKFF